MKNGSNAKPDRVKVYVKSLNKSATVRRVEDDPVWGKQFLVSTYSPFWGPLWGPDLHWVKEEDVEMMNRIDKA